MIEKQFIYNTTETALKHYFDLYVRPAKAALMEGDQDINFKGIQTSFVLGIKQTLDRKLRVSNGVTHGRLREIAETAETGDFSDNDSLLILYTLCKQLK